MLTTSSIPAVAGKVQIPDHLALALAALMGKSASTIQGLLVVGLDCIAGLAKLQHCYHKQVTLQS